jgi:hypothetical protein
MAQEKPIPMDEETSKALDEISDFFEKEPVLAQRIFDEVMEKIKGGK